jgi:hypothetical protein
MAIVLTAVLLGIGGGLLVVALVVRHVAVLRALPSFDGCQDHWVGPQPRVKKVTGRAALY